MIRKVQHLVKVEAVDTKNWTGTVKMTRLFIALHEAAHLVIADEFWGGSEFVYRPRWVLIHPGEQGGNIPIEFYRHPDPIEHAIMAMAGVAANFLGLERLPDVPGCIIDCRAEDGETYEQPVPVDLAKKIFIRGADHDHTMVIEIAQKLERDEQLFMQEVYDRAKGLVAQCWDLIVKVARDLDRAKAYYGTEAMVIVRALKSGDTKVLGIIDKYRRTRARRADPPEGWGEVARGLPWFEPLQDWVYPV